MNTDYKKIIKANLGKVILANRKAQFTKRLQTCVMTFVNLLVIILSSLRKT